jgi:hypothetical protein
MTRAKKALTENRLLILDIDLYGVLHQHHGHDGGGVGRALSPHTLDLPQRLHQPHGHGGETIERNCEMGECGCMITLNL